MFVSPSPTVQGPRNRGFPKLYKVGNIINKGLHREEQNKFSKKASSGEAEPKTSCVLLCVFNCAIQACDI